MNPKIDLSGLKDLHLLSKPPIWPLATGWWILLALCLLILCISLIVRYQWRQRPSVYAIRKIHQMAHKIADDKTYLKNVSQLLKRVGIAAFGRPQVAPLSDTKWQEFLLTQAPDTLSKTETHLIAFAPYEQKLKKPVDRTTLTAHLELWIKKVFKNKKSS